MRTAPWSSCLVLAASLPVLVSCGGSDPDAAIDLEGAPGTVRTISRTVTEGAPSVPDGEIKLTNSGNCALSYTATAISNVAVDTSVKFFWIGSDMNAANATGTIPAAANPSSPSVVSLAVKFNAVGVPSNTHTGQVEVTGFCNEVNPPRLARGSPVRIVVSLTVQPKYADLGTGTPVVTADATGAPPLASWTPTTPAGPRPDRVSLAHFIAGYVVVIGQEGDGPHKLYRFDPFTNNWLSTAQPAGGLNGSSGFTGNRFVLISFISPDRSQHYDPLQDTWQSGTDQDTPAFGINGAGVLHPMGSELITMNSQLVAAYSPAQRRWRTLRTDDAPNDILLRQEPVFVWTGTRLLIWGGRDQSGFRNDGAWLDPNLAPNGSWKTIAAAPIAGRYSSAVWTGNRMFVWGGRNASNAFGDGALYDPATDVWSPIATTGAPAPRASHYSVCWTGRYVLVYGGYDTVNVLGTPLTTGAIFDPFSGTGGTWVRPTPAGGDMFLVPGVWAAGKFVTLSGPDGWLLE